MQWHVKEFEEVRGKMVSLNDRVVKPGDFIEVTGL
jgi:hypothetical protein